MLLISVPLFSCNGKNGKNTAKQMLTAYYTQYIREHSKPQPDKKVISALYDKFLTAELRQKLDGAHLEYDHFLAAQDCNEDWSNTLKITHSEEDKNLYVGSYVIDLKKFDARQNIRLFLVKENGSYLINDIIGLSEAFADYRDNYKDEPPADNSSNKTDSGIVKINGNNNSFQQYHDVMIDIQEKSVENALALTFMNGAAAINATFRLAPNGWFTDSVTLYRPQIEPRTKNIHINLYEFDFETVVDEINSQ